MGWSLWCTLSSCWCCRVLKENIQAFFLDLHLKSRVIYDNYSPKLMAKTWKSPKQMKRNMRSSFCHIHFLGWGCVSYKTIYNFIYIYIYQWNETLFPLHTCFAKNTHAFRVLFLSEGKGYCWHQRRQLFFGNELRGQRLTLPQCCRR